MHELWPGGSRILVDLPSRRQDESKGAAFLVERSGSPRISSVEFSNFCIDGLHFSRGRLGLHPENTYVNGKTGIYVASANDSFRITGMGFVYLEHALTIYNADALSIHDNFIAECGSCIELRGWGQASKITDNLIGAGFRGQSIYAENHGGLLITANNVFPRGASSVHLEGVTRSSVTNNRLHSFYPGMVVLGRTARRTSWPRITSCVTTSRGRRSWESTTGWTTSTASAGQRQQQLRDRQPLLRDHRLTERPSGRRDARHHPADRRDRQLRLQQPRGGDGRHAKSSDSCYSAQVDALLTTEASGALSVTTVLVDPASSGNTILDSGSDAQVVADRAANALRFTPTLGQ